MICQKLDIISANDTLWDVSQDSILIGFAISQQHNSYMEPWCQDIDNEIKKCNISYTLHFAERTISSMISDKLSFLL